MGDEPFHPNDIDPSKKAAYYYSESQSLRIITDDGDLWLGRSLTEPGGMFLALGNEEGDPSFVIKPNLLEVIATYAEMLVKLHEGSQDDDEYPQGEWPGQ